MIATCFPALPARVKDAGSHLFSASRTDLFTSVHTQSHLYHWCSLNHKGQKDADWQSCHPWLPAGEVIARRCPPPACSDYPFSCRPTRGYSLSAMQTQTWWPDVYGNIFVSWSFMTVRSRLILQQNAAAEIVSNINWSAITKAGSDLISPHFKSDQPIFALTPFKARQCCSFFHSECAALPFLSVSFAVPPMCCLLIGTAHFNVWLLMIATLAYWACFPRDFRTRCSGTVAPWGWMKDLLLGCLWTLEVSREHFSSGM